MKYIKQFLIILFFSFLGELLKACIPFAIPSSIYGMSLLFIALITGIIKIEAVRETGLFLVSVMPIMFIPAAVGLIDNFSKLKNFLIPALTITIVVFVLVFFVTGRFAQYLILKHNKKKEDIQ